MPNHQYLRIKQRLLGAEHSVNHGRLSFTVLAAVPCGALAVIGVSCAPPGVSVLPQGGEGINGDKR